MRLPLLLSCLLACSTAQRSGDDTPDPTPDAGGMLSSPCPKTVQDVYVIDHDTFALSEFDPATKTFTDRGVPSCDWTAPPVSMAIDRNGIAWIADMTGDIFRVDINNGLACTKTAWPPALMWFGGMGYSTDQAGGDAETLFVVTGPFGGAQFTGQLATIDMSMVTMDAPLQGFHVVDGSSLGSPGIWPELTGTANAELWGWFPDQTPRLAKLDKTTGALGTTYAEATLAGNPTMWAFAQWGGDFWVFLLRDGETSTTVYQIDGGTGAITSTTPTTRQIIGAGVSTCAPVVVQ
jgi:hypothetical protein